MLIAILSTIAIAFTVLSVKRLGFKNGIKFAISNIFSNLILRPIGMILASFAPLDNALIPSIKPLPNRPQVDQWKWKWMNSWFGNPEDGVTGDYALGSWTGFYNPGRTWLGKIAWNWRNNAAGYNYISWSNDSVMPPIVFVNYSVFGKQRMMKLGWQQLPPSDGWVTKYKVRMVCSF